jgi:hypothetical protein
MHFMDPNNFETLYILADFVSSGCRAFLIEPAWTFSVWFDASMGSMRQFFGISGN